MITIITADLNVSSDTIQWICWLEISDDVDSYLLPATAPSDLAENELQAHFEANEVALWRIAQIKRYPLDHRGIRYTTDLRDLVADAAAEIAWLETNIPLVDTADLATLRGYIRRLMSENLRQIKAWRFVAHRLAND